MIIEATVFNRKVFVNTDKIDYFYNDEGDTKVVIGETVFLVELAIPVLTDVIKG